MNTSRWIPGRWLRSSFLDDTPRPVALIRPIGRLWAYLEVFFNLQAVFELKPLPILTAHRIVEKVGLHINLMDLVLYRVVRFIQGPGYVCIGEGHVLVLKEHGKHPSFLLGKSVNVKLLRSGFTQRS